MRDWELINRICRESELQPETVKGLLFDACEEIIRLNRIVRDLSVLIGVERHRQPMFNDPA